MHVALSRIEHRPWELPRGAWRWRQSWEDLLFAHWPVKAASLRRLVPEGLRIDEYEGTTFVGVVPFRMSGVMLRPMPDLPWISAFPELNVRLYVERDGKPGVWFLSLDAHNPLAVWAARKFFHLPYFRARMACDREGAQVRYASARTDQPRPARFRACYAPRGVPCEARAGTVEHFLTERYCSREGWTSWCGRRRCSIDRVRTLSRLLKKASEGLVLPILPPNPPHFVRGAPAGGGRNNEGNASGTEAGPFSATC